MKQARECSTITQFKKSFDAKNNTILPYFSMIRFVVLNMASDAGYFSPEKNRIDKNASSINLNFIENYTLTHRNKVLKAIDTLEYGSHFENNRDNTH